MSRLVLTASAALTLALGLACTGGFMSAKEATPRYPREEHRSFVVDPPEPFTDMDLPYYGGRIERPTEGYMQVSYRSDIASVEQLVQWWPAALEAEGWVPKVAGQEPNGGFSGSYTTPDGRNGLLTISPTGTLWMVDLSVTDAPED